MSQRKFWLFAVLVVALGLRLIGIWHDCPYSFYPDEAHYVKRALSFGSGDLNPHWFNKPAFFMYILFFEYGVFFVVGKLLQLWKTAEDFGVFFIANPWPFYLIGRLTVLVFSLASIAVTYRLGERHLRPGTGLLAALLLAVSYGHVFTSVDVKGDVPAMFFTILSALLMMNYLAEGKPRQLLMAVIAAGMGTAVKYYSVVMLGPIGLAVLLAPDQLWRHPVRQWRRIFCWWFTIPALFFFSFFVFAPFNFLDPVGRKATFGRFYQLLDVFYSGAVETPSPVRFITQTVSRSESIKSYADVLLDATGMGMLVGGLCLFGLILVFFSRQSRWYFLLFFPVVFFMISTMVYPGYSGIRHQIPIYPFLALCGGFLLVRVGEVIPTTYRSWAALLLVFGLAMPVYKILQNDLFISQQDTRVAAEYWIEENLPAGTRLFLAEKGPNLTMIPAQIDERLARAELADRDGAFSAHYATYLRMQRLAAIGEPGYFIEQPVFPWWREREPEDGNYRLTDYDRRMGNTAESIGIRTLEDYLAEGIEYFVVNSIRYEPFFNPEAGRYRNFPSYVRFYEALFSRGMVIKEFAGGDRPGPTIKVLFIERTTRYADLSSTDTDPEPASRSRSVALSAP